MEMSTGVGVFSPTVLCAASVFNPGQLNPARSHHQITASAIEMLGAFVQDLAGGWCVSSRLACCQESRNYCTRSCLQYWCTELKAAGINLVDCLLDAT